jgi:adenine-specific DNA-methyltransferase
MAKNNTRMELTWIGKENRPKLEPRILIEDPDKSYHAARRVGENDIFDNRLIFGDNLLALKALEQEFTGKIKCIYIDPPFNTQQAFEHYDDSVEHSLWLSLMRDRLQLLRALLTNDGTLFVHLNMDELAHFKVMCDEVFGRRNFLQIVTVKSASTASFRAINLCPVTVTEYILIYTKERDAYQRPMQYVRAEYSEDYGKYIKNKDKNPSHWEIVSLADIVHKKFGFQTWQQAKKTWGVNWKEIRRAEMEVIAMAEPNYVVSLNTMQKPSQTIVDVIEKSKSNQNRVFCLEREKNDPIYVYNGRTLAFFAKKLRPIDGELVPTDVLTNFWGDISYLSLGLEGNVDFKNGKKPEALIKRVLEIATDAGDWVLDSFAGSGTTGAVAHKMNRRWIMVELGEHCQTHIIPRLKGVVNGADESGISKAVNWKGGGGFRYYKLGPSLIVKDEWDNPVINPEFNAGMLAEAMCKLEGFTFDPNPEAYWQQGRSSETDFIYITTQTMTREMLTNFSDEVGPNRSLLICCGAFRCDVSEFENLTVKKIPKAVLSKCEWGHDDYSLEIKNLPATPATEMLSLEPGQLPDEAVAAARGKSRAAARKFGKGKDRGPTLFDMNDAGTKGGK